MKTKRTILLCIALVLCLISMITSSSMLTSGGTVAINDMNIIIPSGEKVHFYEYRPVTATVDTPAPAIVFSHGNDSTLQTHQDYAMELARRGFVVFAFDITSAGMSSPVSDASTIGFGMYDLVDYVYDHLKYVDNTRIGVAGYSKGGNNIYDTLNAYGKEQAASPDTFVSKINAALIIDPKFDPFDGFPTGVNVGFVCGTHDPFNNVSYAPVAGYLPGDLTVKSEIKNFINLGVPGTFAENEMADPNVKVEIGKVYGSFAEKNARVVYNPEYITHASGTIGEAAIRDCVQFFTESLGAPNPIESTNIRSRLHIFIGAIGLVGLLMLIVPLCGMLLETRFFASLVNPQGVPQAPAQLKDAKSALIYFLPPLGLSFLLPLTATQFAALPAKFMSLAGVAGVSEWFLNSWQNGIMAWLFVNGLIALAVGLVVYFMVYKNQGMTLRSMGIYIGLGNTLKTIVLAALVFASCYGVTLFAQSVFMVDFRLQDLTFPVMSWERLLLIMRYAPFVIFFWCVNSMNMNALNRVRGMKEWQNVLLCILLNIVGIVVVLIIHYTKLFSTGAGLSGPFNWKYYTTMLLFLFTATAGTLINRALFKKTGNAFIGPVVFGTIATVLSTAVMMLPDYLY